MDKIVVTSSEVAQVAPAAAGAAVPETRLPPPVPLSARIALSFLVLFLPLLCLAALAARIGVRHRDPRTRQAWLGFLSTLLIVSGLVSSVVGTLVFWTSPPPAVAVISQGIASLDAREEFPQLPAERDMDAADIASKLKPLAYVVTPTRRSWFLQRRPFGETSIAAAVLIHSDSAGHLFATGRHVVDGPRWTGVRGGRASVTLASVEGDWANAGVAGRHKDEDLALLWLPRRAGRAEFRQPLTTGNDVVEGRHVFVIGHPEGLLYSISNGIISRLPNHRVIQISAPVSPGNSGGPVYDERGRLAGIVSAKVDRALAPNAESLGFAIRADLLLDENAWTFEGTSREAWRRFAQR